MSMLRTPLCLGLLALLLPGCSEPPPRKTLPRTTQALAQVPARPEPWEAEVRARAAQALRREAARAWARELEAVRLIVVPQGEDMSLIPVFTLRNSTGASVPPLPTGVPEITDMTPMLEPEPGINVLWGWDGSGQTGFLLERSSDGVTFDVRVGATDAVTTNLTDHDVEGGGPFYYRVAAFNGLESNHGDWSSVAGPISWP